MMSSLRLICSKIWGTLPRRAMLLLFWSNDRGLACLGHYCSDILVEKLLDLLEELVNADAMPSAAIVCGDYCGLTHIGLGPVSTQGRSSWFEPACGSPSAALAEADSEGLLHNFKGTLLAAMLLSRLIWRVLCVISRMSSWEALLRG